jgi:magnesium transporter
MLLMGFARQKHLFSITLALFLPLLYTQYMTITPLTCGRVTWINLIDPSPEDVQQLATLYPNFHPLNLQACLTELEFPKLDHHDDYIFLVVQFPYWDAGEQVSRPAEVDIFISNGLLITSHRNELKPLREMFETAQKDEQARIRWMDHGASPLLYQLMNSLVDYCYPIVQRVHQNLNLVDERIFHDKPRHLLQEVAFVRRDIISLRSILNPQREVVGGLIRGNWPFIHEDLDPYWGDINDHLSQLCSLLDQYSEVVNGLADTIDTLASHRIDDVVRVLTIVTVLTLPVTVLSTIFSMNVRLPFGAHPMLFFLVLGLGIGLTGFLLWFLRKQKWL